MHCPSVIRSQELPGLGFFCAQLCPDVSCTDGDGEQEQAGESWNQGMGPLFFFFFFLVLLCPALLALASYQLFFLPG